MSVVVGEDTESSDEEINTDQLHESSKPSAVTGGDDVTVVQEDIVSTASISKTVSSSMDSLSSRSKAQWDPPSLLHKRLGEANLSLRKNIVDCILKLYHMTCHNLSIVNDNLSKAQGVIEKVNANVKRSDQDLAQLKSNLDEIFDTATSLAPTLRLDINVAKETASNS